MLTLFDYFTVPGVDYVTIYKDDQDLNMFYMFPESPSLAIGSDGGPQFRFMVFARDFHLMKDVAANLDATETEGGILSMTTQLAVANDDQAKIRSYIAGMRGEGLRAIFVRPGLHRFEWFAINDASAIKLAYPIWVDGSVRFTLIPSGGGATFIKGEDAAAKPSLVGENLANYSVLLGQEGVELVRGMVGKGWTPGSVDYSVTFMARIPCLTVDVTGKVSDAYDQIRENCCAPFYFRNRCLLMYQPLGDLKDVQTKVSSLTIKVSGTDFPVTGGDKSMADQVQSTLMSTALDVIKNFLENQFFTTFSSSAASSDDASSGGSEAPPPPGRLFLRPRSQSNEVEFHISYDKNVPVVKNPNRALLDIMSANDVTKHIVTADLSDPYFQILDVAVRVTADFQTDPIAAINVFLDYDQKDDVTGDHKKYTREFTFLNGTEVFNFQTVMAKNADGSPKDTYRFWSQINYKFTPQSPPSSPRDVNDRALIIGYNQMNCVRVQASWGAIPSDAISRVQVHFDYPDKTLGTASLEKDVYLSPDHTADTWFTYTGTNPSTEYTYAISYFFTSGERLDMPAQKSSLPTQIVISPFVDTMEVTFIPQGTFPPLASIVVSAKYADKSSGHARSDMHTLASSGDSWTWTVRLLDKTQRAFQYKADVRNADGSIMPGSWTPGTEGTILVGQAAQQILEVDVIPALLDLQKTWKLVIVRLKYEDPEHNVALNQIFQISAANSSQPFSWRVPLADPHVNRYTYEIDAYGFDATNKVVGPFQTDNRALVLQI